MSRFVTAFALAALVASLVPATPVSAADAAATTGRYASLSQKGLADRLRSQHKTFKPLAAMTARAKSVTAAYPKAKSIARDAAAFKPFAAAPTKFVYPQTERVSVDYYDDEFPFSNLVSRHQSMSADSRYVVFSNEQVYLRDRQAGTTELISKSTAGDPANDAAGQAMVITPDGRYVAFWALASNLVPNDNNGVGDVFVRDRTTNTTERVSLTANGQENGTESYARIAISADGRFVAFVAVDMSGATGIPQVYLHDRQTHTSELISRNQEGGPSNAEAINVAMSADARFVTFDSRATDLVNDLPFEDVRVYLRDRKSGTTVLVGAPEQRAEEPSISSDGSKVAYHSAAYDPELDQTNLHVYVRDFTAKTVTQADVLPSGQVIAPASYQATLSADGKVVAFASGQNEIFVRDLKANTFRLATVSSSNLPANGFSYYPSLSADGKYVSYFSEASNLVDYDTNTSADVFVNGPDVFPATIDRAPLGTPAAYLYAYFADSNEFMLVGAGTSGGTFIQLATPPGRADGWVMEGFLTEPVTKAQINKKDADVASDGFSFAMEITPPSTKATPYTLDTVDLNNNKGSLSIQTVVDSKLPKASITTANPISISPDGFAKIQGKGDEPLLGCSVVTHNPNEDESPVDNICFIDGASFTVYAFGLSTGKYRVVVFDGVGNESVADSKGADARDIVLDEVPPERPTITSLYTFDGGAYFTNATTPTVAGVTEPFARVYVELPDVRIRTTAYKDGKFSVKSPFALPDGNYPLLLSLIDTVGNQADYESLLVIDTVAPQPQMVYLENPDTGEQFSGVQTAPNAYSFGFRTAPTGTMVILLNETLRTAKVNNSTSGVTIDGTLVTFPVKGLRSGTNTLTLDGVDFPGNAIKVVITIKVDSQAPALTLTSPAGDLALGIADGREAIVTFSGTSSKDLASLQIWEALEDGDVQIDAAVTLNGPKGAFTAKFALDPVESVRTFYVTATDLAGNMSVKSSKVTRKVTVDPSAPVLTFDPDPGFVDNVYVVTETKATSVNLQGTIHDDGMGVSQLMFGTAKATLTKSGDDWTFNQRVSLTEGVNDIKIVGSDKAGNTTAVYRILAMIKSKITNLTARAAFSTSKRSMTVSGTVDKAVLTPNGYVGIVPIHITVRTRREGETLVMFEDTLIEPSEYYNPQAGTFRFALDTDGWMTGKYEVIVTAEAPAEFGDITPRTLPAINLNKTR